MIIHPPTETQTGSNIRISARIEFESGNGRALSKARSETPSLWFQFPKQFDSEISRDLDPFAVALLLVAMQKGEPLRIHGSLSERLYEGLRRYQAVYNGWYPDRFAIIEILPDRLRVDPPLFEAGQVGCAFSGGVDSFYTFLALLREPQRVTRTLFMAGFDMPLHLTESIQELTESYSDLMKEKNIPFVIGSTNIRTFVNTVDWTNAHGQALAASALFFKTTWKAFYIPSSYKAESYPKWGTHPSLDPLLSTESLTFVHHGDDANRVKKLETISEAAESYNRLRVCWIQDIALKNCGNCEKCIRTQIALDLIGALPLYTTFKEILTSKKIRELPQRTYQGRLFACELIKEALKRRKFKTCWDLSVSLLRRRKLRRSLKKVKVQRQDRSRSVGLHSKGSRID